MHRTAHEPIDKMACSPKLIWFFLSINTLPTNTSNIFDIKKSTTCRNVRLMLVLNYSKITLLNLSKVVEVLMLCSNKSFFLL